jgi:Mrp family chromosome partitioning ATPase
MSALQQRSIPPEPLSSLMAPLDVPDALVRSCRSISLQLGGPMMRSIAVTSAIRGEGRTCVAGALAKIQAEDYGRRVVLLDMDFEAPSLARRLGAEPEPGLAELARGEAELSDIAQHVDDQVTLIAAGSAGGLVVRVATTLAESDVLNQIGRACDVVIADLPPLLTSGAARVLAPSFDMLGLVIRAGVTPLPQIKQAVATLKAEPAVILNDVSTNLPAWLRRLTGA